MIVFPNAKINLGLNIISKRPDNYHNIETVFYPLTGLRDALEVVPAQGPEKCNLHLSGFAIDGDPGKNLVTKAYNLLSTQFNIPPVDVFLHKAVPFGAGLGGGSADASFMLCVLRDLFMLPISNRELDIFALSLGADCPFFLHNKPVLARGLGNEFEPVQISLAGYHIVLIKPDIAIPTPEAYSLVKPSVPAIPLKDVVRMPVEEWQDYMFNDFENSVFVKHPVIEVIKNELYNQGAVYASMSGSGSSVYGLFKNAVSLDLDFSQCFVWHGTCEI